MRRRALLLAFVVPAGAVLSSCATAETAAPRCEAPRRVGITSQAVPGASFVPCVAELPAGWSVESFDVSRGSASFSLRSDRADQPVEVRFDDSCDVEGATAVTPRDDGVRTYVRVEAVSPRYAGQMLDVFPGGCVTYSFDFERGPHIALTDELRASVDLYPRRELRRALED